MKAKPLKMAAALVVAALAAGMVLAGCSNPNGGNDPDTITISAIGGVTIPAAGGTPAAAITATGQYTGTVAWEPADTTFAGGTVYTATITLTAKTGYTLQGVGANFFTVAGASAANSANSGVITAVFPAIGSLNWTAIPAGTGSGTSTFDTSLIRGIAWGNNRFVAVGDNGKMAYSANGVNWTAIPAGTGSGTPTFGTSDVFGIAWGNNRFVAVGGDGKMAYSADGTSWTAISAGTGSGTSTFGTDYIHSIAWGNNRFVAGGMNGKMAYSDSAE